MSVRGPWDRDDRELQALSLKLRKTQEECDALKDLVRNRDAQLQHCGEKLNGVLSNLQDETKRVQEYEEKFFRAQEELRREHLHTQHLEELTKHAREKADKEAKRSKVLELELDNPTADIEHQRLLDRIKVLEKELSDGKPSTSSAPARTAAKILELENRVLALQAENTRLLSLGPGVSHPATSFPLSSPIRASRIAHDLNRHDGLTPSIRRRPRSSSVSSDLKLTRLEQELERCQDLGVENGKLKSKLATMQRDLIAAQNDKLAQEQRFRREAEEDKDLLEQKDDEIFGLREFLESVPNIDVLQAKVAENDSRRERITASLAALEGKIENRLVALKARISCPRSPLRSHTPKLSTPVVDPILLQAKISELEARLVAKEMVTQFTLYRDNSLPLAAHINRDAHSLLETRIQDLESQVAAQKAITASRKSVVASKDLCYSPESIPRAEYQALLNECEELEKEIDTQQTALNLERGEKEHYLSELKQLRQNLKAASLARKELSRVVDLQSSISVDNLAGDSNILMSEILPKVVLPSAISSCPEWSDATVELRRTGEGLNQGQLAEIAALVDRLRTERDDLRRTVKFLHEETQAQGMALEVELSQANRTAQGLERQLVLNVDELKVARFPVGSGVDDATMSQPITSRNLAAPHSSVVRNEEPEICALTALGRNDELCHQTTTEYHSVQSIVVQLNSRLSRCEGEAKANHLLLVDMKSRTGLLQKRASRFALAVDATFVVIQHLQKMSESEALHLHSEIEDLRIAVGYHRGGPTEVEVDNQQLNTCLNAARRSSEAKQIASAQTGAMTKELDDLLVRCQGLEDTVDDLRRQLLASASECRHLHANSAAYSSSRRRLGREDEEQLEQLRLRVDRRTEQIGILQGDMARLKTNFVLLEDANAELASELETKTAEYNHMIADCAEARAARDAAIARLETLEEEMDRSLCEQPGTDGLTTYDETQVAAVVREIFLAVGRARTAENVLACSHEALVEAANLERRLQESEEVREHILQELDCVVAKEREASKQLSVSQSQAEALLQAESQRRRQFEVIAAECDELRRLLKSAVNERDDLVASLAKAQDEIAALDKVHSDVSNNQQLIRDLQEQLEKSRTTVESLEAEKDHQLREYDVNIEELRGHLAKVTADYDLQLSNLSRAYESEADNYKTRQAQATDRLQALTIECHSLQAQLVSLSNKSSLELEQTVRRLGSESEVALASVKAERDLVLEELAEARHALESLSTSRSVETEVLRNELNIGNRRLQVLEENQRGIICKLEEAQAQLSEKEEAIRSLEGAASSLQKEVEDRATESKRLAGMKRFLDQDVKRLEAEVTRTRKELKQSHEQADECRRRMRELDITTARDKSRLLAELHAERDGATSLVQERDDALEQLGTLKKEILELHKTQRKKDIQLNLVKEKLKTFQHGSNTTMATEAPSIVRPKPSTLAATKPVAPQSNPLPSIPPRNPSTASTIINFARASFAPKTSTTSRPSVRPSTRPSAMTASISAPSLPLSARPQTEEEQPSKGKRKREVDDELENRTPAQPIMAPPRSPSRLRTITEKGLRALTPKRSPSKQRSVFTRASPPDDLQPVPPLPRGLGAISLPNLGEGKPVTQLAVGSEDSLNKY